MNESTLEALVEGANSVIRLILGQLQMVRLSSKALSYDEVKVCTFMLLPHYVHACVHLHFSMLTSTLQHALHMRAHVSVRACKSARCVVTSASVLSPQQQADRLTHVYEAVQEGALKPQNTVVAQLLSILHSVA